MMFMYFYQKHSQNLFLNNLIWRKEILGEIMSAVFISFLENPYIPNLDREICFGNILKLKAKGYAIKHGINMYCFDESAWSLTLAV